MARRKNACRRARRIIGPCQGALFPTYRPILLAALGLGSLAPASVATFPASLNLSALDGTNGFRIDGVAAGDFSGFAVGAARDMNGDGVADLLIGALGCRSER